MANKQVTYHLILDGNAFMAVAIGIGGLGTFFGAFFLASLGDYCFNHIVLPTLQMAIIASQTMAGRVLYWLCSTNPNDLQQSYQMLMSQDLSHLTLGSWPYWAKTFAIELIPFVIPLLLATLGITWVVVKTKRRYPHLSH